MSRDFFLLNRCFQIARICRSSNDHDFVLPPAKARGHQARTLNDFYALLDRICNIANSDSDTSVSERAQTELSDDQRRDLEEFERIVVANRFNADEAIKRPAVSMIRAIFADANYFSGLKPLPQYTDAFAYELLFPSWLNLLKAVMLPRADNGKPRLEGARQGALFEFLTATKALTESHYQLMIGYMTFIASRFDAPRCEDLLQRMVDLVTTNGASIVDSISEIDLVCKDARELRSAISDYLLVQTSLTSSTGASAYTVAYSRPIRRPLPEFIGKVLAQHIAQQNWSDFLTIAHPLRTIFESQHSLTPEFIALLSQHPQRFPELLGLLSYATVPGESKVLAAEGQIAVTRLGTAQPDLLEHRFACLQKFAAQIAPKLHNFSDGFLKYFSKVLIDDASGRQLLLEALHNPTACAALVEQILGRAGKTDDISRALYLFSCACVVSPAVETIEAQTALHAIEAVVHNRTIGNRELSDLIADLQTNSGQALEYLASPMRAAAGKTPRVAALYLTLNEVSQKLGATKTVDNFSVVRAKYSKLTNLE